MNLGGIIKTLKSMKTTIYLLIADDIIAFPISKYAAKTLPQRLRKQGWKGDLKVVRSFPISFSGGFSYSKFSFLYNMRLRELGRLPKI